MNQLVSEIREIASRADIPGDASMRLIAIANRIERVVNGNDRPGSRHRAICHDDEWGYIK